MAQNATEIVFTFLSRSSPAVLCREIRDPVLTASEIHDPPGISFTILINIECTLLHYKSSYHNVSIINSAIHVTVPS